MTINFCPSCGTQIPQAASFCPGCGAKLTPQGTTSPVPTNVSRESLSGGRSKATAVILAFFFGSFSYLYVARTHAGWFGQSLAVLLVGGGIGLGIISGAAEAGNAFGVLIGLAATVMSGFIWGGAPLIHFAVKSPLWFELYDLQEGPVGLRRSR